jgi:DNA-binding NtrC family response regulator
MNEPELSVHVLTVSPFDSDLVILSNVISHSAWTHRSARGLKEARKMLAAEDVHVVLCEARLPDGDWQGMLDFISGLETPPELIVLSRHADEELWATVLNLGAWDLLVPPFSPKEVYRTVHHAFRHWSDASRLRSKQRAQTMTPAPKISVAGV